MELLAISTTTATPTVITTATCTYIYNLSTYEIPYSQKERTNIKYFECGFMFS